MIYYHTEWERQRSCQPEHIERTRKRLLIRNQKTGTERHVLGRVFFGEVKGG
jgi:hypothetical protein